MHHCSLLMLVCQRWHGSVHHDYLSMPFIFCTIDSVWKTWKITVGQKLHIPASQNHGEKCESAVAHCTTKHIHMFLGSVMFVVVGKQLEINNNGYPSS